MKTKKIIKLILSILFLIINILIVYYIAKESFRNDTTMYFGTIFQRWMEHWPYFVVVLLLPLLAIFAEGMKYFIMIVNTTKKPRLGLALKTAAIGKYYDNITPLGTGGQPFQVYYLYKNGISSEISGVMPVVSVTIQQLTMVIISILTFIFLGKVIEIPALKIAAYIGAGFSMLFPLAVICFALLPKLSTAIVGWFLRLMHKLKIIKKVEEKQAKVEEYLIEFKSSMKYIAQSFTIIFPLILLTIVYYTALYSIPYFAIIASGFDASYVQVTAMCVFVYSAIAFIPTPGNSGGAEISFKMIFTILSGGLLFWTMILWRFASYLIIIFVGLTTLIYDFGLKRALRKMR